ncbi:S9 family peptidase [Candidatus Haliotispira prima]|uniref:S9 family peptidase n=1 Tax=Candidatus Haliotispira prima TaxID=3034016 RepID=A0ABY8MK55_9SPIO|nr:S9 family peptidase [Candidatus Haliotispira prima]
MKNMGRLYLLFTFIFILFSCNSLSRQVQQDTSSVAPEYSYDEFSKVSKLSELAFSPSSDDLYFIQDGNIATYDPESETIGLVYDHPEEPIHSYLFSPDGETLYFEMDRGGSELYEIYRYDLAEQKAEVITQYDGKEKSILGKFSEDGKKLFFLQTKDGQGSIAIIAFHTETGELEEIVAKDGTWYADFGIGDRYIAYIEFHTNDSNTLYLRELEGNEEPIVIQEGKNGTAEVSTLPLFFKGDELYMLSTLDSSGERLWVYNTATKEKKLASGKEAISGLKYFPALDKTVLEYRGTFQNETKLFDGIVGKALSLPLENITEIVQHPNRSDVKVLVQSAGNVPGKYYYVHGDDIKLAYNANLSGIPDADFGKIYSVFVKSFDGMKVPTHFLVPNGTSTENKRPVVLLVHGGPQDVEDPNFSNVKQYFANRGFIMAIPNVRGSGGYGTEYQNMDNGDWGGSHIKDLIAVSDYAKTMPFVDSENMFIIGGSFGGFSVLSTITQYPEYFNAAVDIFGPAELASFVDSYNSPAAQAYWILEMGGDPRTDDALNKRVSPYYHVDKIKTPLQVHHGANDIRVPIAQSEEIVQKLQDAGKEVEYFRYENEGHGFVHSENEKKVYEEAVHFFNEHSK